MKMGHVTLTTLIWGQFVIHMPTNTLYGLAVQKLKIFENFEDTKEDPKRIWGDLGCWVARGHRQYHHSIERISY